MTLPPITYKEFYNKDRGLPEPVWGPKLKGEWSSLQCPTCGSRNMYASASPDDPEEIFPNETVRCGACGHITDWYEAYKQRKYHPCTNPRKVIKEES